VFEGEISSSYASRKGGMTVFLHLKEKGRLGLTRTELKGKCGGSTQTQREDRTEERIVDH